MTTQPSLGHAEAYISIHLSRSGHSYHGKPAGPFFTVSRESGTGGSTFAAALAAQLDNEMPGETPWTVFDRNVVETMLQSRHLSPRIARFLPEDKVSEIDASVGELMGLHPSLWELTQRTNETMRHLAHTGHVILVGRGANFATSAIPNGVHVRLVATAEHRGRHMGRELGIATVEAASHNEKIDAARRKFVRSVFDADIALPSNYDLCLNVASLPLEQACQLAAAVLQTRMSALV